MTERGRRHTRRAPAGGSTSRAPDLRRFIEHSVDIFYRLATTDDQALEYVSPGAAAITGYTVDELYADPSLWQRLVHPDDRRLIPDFATLAEQGREAISAPTVLRWVRRDGAIRWTEHRSVPVYAEDGSLIAIEGMARDITDQVEEQARLRGADARLRDLLSSIDLGALVLDRSGKVEFINDFLLQLMGSGREEVLGRDWIDHAVPERERTALRESFHAAIDGAIGAGRREDGLVTRSGDERRLLWTSAVQRDSAGRVIGLAGIAHDVTDARRIEAERARLATAIEQSAESVLITDLDGRIVYVNHAFERLSGYAGAEVIGRNPRILNSGLQSASFYDAMWAALSNGLPWIADIVNRRKDGSLYSLNSALSPIHGPDGAITGYVDVARDVSHERELETRAEVLTRERALIGETLRSLPPGEDIGTTAELFCRQVASLADIAVAVLLGFESTESAVPLAYVGPDARELGLRPLSRDRSRYLHEHATSGPWVEEWSPGEAHPYAQSIERAGVRAFAYAPIRGGGGLLGVLAIGSSEPDAISQLTDQLAALVDFADLAGALLVHGVGDRRRFQELRSDIERLIAERAFFAVFQPIVDMRTGHVVGHEALTRFQDGGRPDLRFADADAVGLGLDLERAALEVAITAADGRLSPSRWLHLNVSPELVLMETVLAELLRGVHARIVLEVTEHVAVDDYQAFRVALAGLGRPVQLAVDDAGAGFASLRHILELEPVFVKLDLTLIRGIDADPAKQALVAGMHHFARTTRRRLIAEGVETEAEAAALRALDVRLGQGYLFGRPVRLSGDTPLEPAGRGSSR